MELTLTEEQQALKDTLNRFIAQDYDAKARHAAIAAPGGFSAANWRQFADLGLLALPFAEAHGGLNGSAIDTMVVMESIGRGLIVEPYLSTVVLCGGLVQACGNEAQQADILPAIASGDLLMAFAHYESGGRYEIEQVSLTAQPSGSGYMLDGSKTCVLDGETANRLIVSAREGRGLSLFLVDRNAPGISVTGYATQDDGRAADIRFDRVTVSAEARLGPAGEAEAAILRAMDSVHAALCAEAVGAMEALNAATLEYLKTRKQFGVPIGSFQALQHRMVDMATATEQARSMAVLAAIRVQSGSEAERRWATSAARVLVGEAARLVGQQAVQLHGGMGVTDELIVSHYFRRLTAINLSFGDVDHHLGYVSDALL
ncbi:MAG: acyl-CoA dehydrogenase family protein [Betaproteobacteria bacterium]|nr:acyl-CoA dehydrogenase family protein [Betaproteobacteria bacterium]